MVTLKRYGIPLNTKNRFSVTKFAIYFFTKFFYKLIWKFHYTDVHLKWYSASLTDLFNLFLEEIYQQQINNTRWKFHLVFTLLSVCLLYWIVTNITCSSGLEMAQTKATFRQLDCLLLPGKQQECIVPRPRPSFLTFPFNGGSDNLTDKVRAYF